MLSGSSWAGRGDRAYASVEHPQQRRLTEWKDDGIREGKRARRRAEFAARIPAMAADMASEISAAVASEVNAAVAAALDAMFARRREAILDAVTTWDRARVPSATTPTSSSSDTHAPTVALASTSSSVQTALATPTTCSTDCPVRAAASVVSTITPAAASTPSTGTVGVVSEQCCFDIEPAPVTSNSPAAASIFSGDTSMVIGEAPVTTACTARDGCIYPVAQLVAMPIPVPVVRAGCAPTMGSPNTDITQSPRVLAPATTKPTTACTALLTLSESKESGMCSSLGCATTHLCCLLPWDPGETTRLLKYSVLSTATVGGTCVKLLNADSVGSSDQRQKLRQYMERLVASDLTYYPAICVEQVPSEDFLSGFFGLVQNNCQPQYLEVSESCYCSELMFKGATHLSPEYIPWKIAWLLVLSADTHSLAIERKPRPPPPTIHVFVPARERNAWMQSWLELLLFKNDNALEALLCCDTTGTCWMNKHMGLTVGNDTDSGEFMSSVPAHSCTLINGFHYEQIWDPGGLCSCAWNCQVRSTEQWSPLKGMCAIQYLMKPQAGVNCYQISIDLHATSSHADCYPQTIAETRSLSCVVLSIGHFVKYLTYVTGTSAMPQTLAALGVHDGSITNEHKVALTLKLMDMALFKTKEMSLLALLPQLMDMALATFSRGTSLNQLRGMCSDRGGATVRSLLPWDPGEETGVPRDSVLSRDSVWGPCVKQLIAGLIDSYDHNQQPSVVPFLVASATQQEFMDKYRVTAVVSRLLILVMMRNEVVLWLFLQSALANTFFLLQWDPGNAKIFHICNQYCPVNYHLVSAAVTKELAHNKLLHAQFQLYTMDFASLHGHAHTQASVLDTIIPSQLEYLLQSWDAEQVCFGVSASFSCEVLKIGDHKLMANNWHNVELLSRVQDVQLLLKFVRSSEHNATFSESFISSVSVILLRDKLQLSWDPGGSIFFGFFPPAEEKGGRDAAAPVYYCGYCIDRAFYFDKVCANHDYFRGIFLEQACTICYLNFLKGCVTSSTCSNLAEVMKLKVPWDPGGSTRRRLEVKPKIKEGGMLATSPLYWAWAVTIGLGLLGSHGIQRLQVSAEWIRPRWLGTGRLRPPLLLSSPSSSLPLASPFLIPL